MVLSYDVKVVFLVVLLSAFSFLGFDLFCKLRIFQRITFCCPFLLVHDCISYMYCTR